MAPSRFHSSRVGMIQFPGSNCDEDCIMAFRRTYEVELLTVWHTETQLPELDRIILPGGFSYGDYLRGGALASHSPIVKEVKRFAAAGGPVLGICNGFQVLTESHILPGVLLKNQSQKFVCKLVELDVIEGSSPYHMSLEGSALSLPVAHGEGRFYIDEQGLKALEDQRQILLKYRSNHNGSVASIAGVTSQNGKVMGLMPHPERAVEPHLRTGTGGRQILNAFMAV